MTLGQDSYRWILYGDDDTYFNVDAALRMVNGLDHRTPYLLSDNIWFPAQNGARRCITRLLDLRLRTLLCARIPVPASCAC